MAAWSGGLVGFDGQKWQLYDLDVTPLQFSGQAKNTDLYQLPKDLYQLIKSVYCSCGGCSRLTIYACGCGAAQEVEAGFEEQLALEKTVDQIRAEYLALHGSKISAFGDVNWLVQTPDGRLWTESWDMDGQTLIASFDGQKWTAEFNTDNSLLDITETVLATSTGEILLGTDQGLFQYDPVLNRRIYESSERVL